MRYHREDTNAHTTTTKIPYGKPFFSDIIKHIHVFILFFLPAPKKTEFPDPSIGFSGFSDSRNNNQSILVLKENARNTTFIVFCGTEFHTIFRIRPKLRKFILLSYFLLVTDSIETGACLRKIYPIILLPYPFPEVSIGYKTGRKVYVPHSYDTTKRRSHINFFGGSFGS